MYSTKTLPKSHEHLTVRSQEGVFHWYLPKT